MAFISFCFENPLSQIAIIQGLQSACYQSFMKCGQLVYQFCSCFQKIVMHQTIIMFSYSCFKVHLKFPSIIFLSIKKLSLDVPCFYLMAPSTQAWNTRPNFLVNCQNFGLGPHKICLLNVEMGACKVDPQFIELLIMLCWVSNSIIQLCSNIKHEMKIKLKLKGCSLLISISIRLLENISYGWHTIQLACKISLKLCFTLSFFLYFFSFCNNFLLNLGMECNLQVF